MGGHIEAVKSNVQNLRDHLANEYKGCDLRFAFVRYTDYDVAENTRTTWVDFTRYQSTIIMMFVICDSCTWEKDG